MSHSTRSGRHRAANRYSPVAELTSIVKSAGGTGARASAVLAASGGLVATFALPAQALPASKPAAAQSAGAETATDVLSGSRPQAAAAPAVTAPEVTAPVKTETVGVSGVKAVAKPKPKPKPKPEPVQETVTEAASTRSTTTTASRSQSASPAPTATNVPQTVSGIVGIAKQYIGVPYVSGGSSPSGFDCSGLTQYVYGQAGISLPRTAAAQQAAATPVSNPQPGDLVFFGYPAWHVGIYAGNGMMIDSPKPGMSVSYRSIFSGVSGYGRPS